MVHAVPTARQKVANALLTSVVATSIAVHRCGSEEVTPTRDIFAKENLVAWCIVPFDAKKRGPAARAEMLQRLGLKRVAYDWRQEHVATFEQEILEYKQRGLEYFAFWDEHEEAFRLFQKHAIRPQIWKIIPDPTGNTHAAKVRRAAETLIPLVERTRKMGCKLGLYNHGGWGGEPGHMVAVCRWLRETAGAHHVGIVYNFHHGHEHIQEFPYLFAKMLPYLLCVNLNGMNERAIPKIVPLGKGQHEREMLEVIRSSSYRGPIGILDHRHQVDAEESLRQNLIGLEELRRSS